MLISPRWLKSGKMILLKGDCLLGFTLNLHHKLVWLAVLKEEYAEPGAKLRSRLEDKPPQSDKQ